MIDDSAAGDMAAFEAGVGNVVEITERVGIVQRAVFAEAFDVVAALHLVQPDLLAEIGPRNDVAVLVEIEAPGVAAAFREQLELARERMIPPDALLKLNAANVRRHRAALRAVEPAVRAPGQRVRHRMSVLQTKPAQQHFGIAIGNIVMIAVGVKQQVRRLNDEHAAVAYRHAGSEVQTGDEVLEFVRHTVAIGVFADRDAVLAFGPARRRLRHAVVFRSQILVNADRFQPGGRRILQILNDPHPAALVEADGKRLPDVRLAGDELCLEAIRDFHVLQRFLGRKPSGKRGTTAPETNGQ